MYYPVSFSELHNLVELRMDILRDKPLPKEYKGMKHLQKLIFTDGQPNVVSLKDDTFDTVSKSNISGNSAHRLEYWSYWTTNLFQAITAEDSRSE